MSLVVHGETLESCSPRFPLTLIRVVTSRYINGEE